MVRVDWRLFELFDKLKLAYSNFLLLPWKSGSNEIIRRWSQSYPLGPCQGYHLWGPKGLHTPDYLEKVSALTVADMMTTLTWGERNIFTNISTKSLSLSRSCTLHISNQEVIKLVNFVLLYIIIIHECTVASNRSPYSGTVAIASKLLALDRIYSMMAAWLRATTRAMKRKSFLKYWEVHFFQEIASNLPGLQSRWRHRTKTYWRLRRL